MIATFRTKLYGYFSMCDRYAIVQNIVLYSKLFTDISSRNISALCEEVLHTR